MTSSLVHHGFAFLLILFWSASVLGQPDRLWQEKHYGLANDSESKSLWGDFGFALRSNTVSNALTNQTVFDGLVDPTTSSALRDLSSDRRVLFNGAVEGSLWYKHKRQEGPSLLVGMVAQERALANIPAGLVQLYFEGNAPFAGSDIDLGPGRLQYWSSQGIGFGMEWKKNGWHYGATLSLLKVSRFQRLETGNGAYLFTEEYGEYIEANLNLDWVSTSTQQNKFTAWNGTGLQTNLYLSYAPDEGSSSLSLQVIDLGAAHFGGVQRNTIDRDTLYTGIPVNDILNFETDLNPDADLDSLEALIGLERSNEGGFFFMPGRLQIDYTYEMSEMLSLAVQLQQHFFQSPPQFRLGMAWQMAPAFALEPYLRLGGFSRLDYGVTAVLNVKQRFQCILRYELIERQLVSENSSGQALSVGAALHF